MNFHTLFLPEVQAQQPPSVRMSTVPPEVIENFPFSFGYAHPEYGDFIIEIDKRTLDINNYISYNKTFEQKKVIPVDLQYEATSTLSESQKSISEIAKRTTKIVTLTLTCSITPYRDTNGRTQFRIEPIEQKLNTHRRTATHIETTNYRHL